MKYQSPPAVIVLIVCMTILSSTSVHAFPNSGAACYQCHTDTSTNLMQITPQSLKIDLGTQLDGSVNGPLETFVVEPGGTVQLSMDVQAVSDTWAAVLRQFDKGGQEQNQANMLVWSQTGNTGWNSNLNKNPPYMVTSAVDDPANLTLLFSFTVDASTQPDVYELVFAIATSAMTYQEESFYLDVASAAPTTWAGYSIDGNGNIDTGDWMGLINVSNPPWGWVYNESKYIYLPDEDTTATGGWIYLPR